MNLATTTGKTELPLLAPEPTPESAWEDWTPAEPLAPQGAHSDGQLEAVLELPPLPRLRTSGRAELLAPAGGPDAALRGLPLRRRRHLPGPEEVLRPRRGRELHPRRGGRDHRLRPQPDSAASGVRHRQHADPPGRTAELVEALAALDEIGVDAVILQDLGVYRAGPPILPETGAARQHAAGRPQPRRGARRCASWDFAASCWPAS